MVVCPIKMYKTVSKPEALKHPGNNKLWGAIIPLQMMLQILALHARWGMVVWVGFG